MIYNIVFQVYSKVIQLCICIYSFFFRFFSHVGYHRVIFLIFDDLVQVNIILIYKNFTPPCSLCYYFHKLCIIHYVSKHRFIVFALCPCFLNKVGGKIIIKKYIYTLFLYLPMELPLLVFCVSSCRLGSLFLFPVITLGIRICILYFSQFLQSILYQPKMNAEIFHCIYPFYILFILFYPNILKILPDIAIMVAFNCEAYFKELKKRKMLYFIYLDIHYFLSLTSVLIFQFSF